MVNGSFYSNDLRDGQFIPTLLGDNQIQVGIRVDHCSRRLIDANVSPLYKTDIPSSNGVIHIVSFFPVEVSADCNPLIVLKLAV